MIFAFERKGKYFWGANKEYITDSLTMQFTQEFIRRINTSNLWMQENKRSLRTFCFSIEINYINNWK